MDFVHTPYQQGETIAAIATPPGEGGIAIIRISGERAIAVADALFSGPVTEYLTHTAHYGHIVDSKGDLIDEALLLVMRAPRSYTGEDTVELQCHGGMIASKKVLDAVLQAGARSARPGEFTFKAFLNGKLDLAQAEAVQRLISAKNTQAFEMAAKHLDGSLSKRIKTFQEDLVRQAAILEAWVDFPEEGIAFTTLDVIVKELSDLHKEMLALHATFEDGQRIEHGISLCIAGPPNAGKSSLMNALLRHERAIVTPVAGTTRDLLREDLILGGLHFHLIDTAGIRETEEIVEKEGIRRSKEAAQGADLILLVLDITAPPPHSLIDALPKEKTVVVWNKIDLHEAQDKPLCPQLDFPHQVVISVLEKRGLDRLMERLESLVWKGGTPPKDQVVITTHRHKEALSEAIAALEKVIGGLGEGVSPEFLAADMQTSLRALGQMIGANITEDILSSIFAQFCVGK